MYSTSKSGFIQPHLSVVSNNYGGPGLALVTTIGQHANIIRVGAPSDETGVTPKPPKPPVRRHGVPFGPINIMHIVRSRDSLSA